MAVLPGLGAALGTLGISRLWTQSKVPGGDIESKTVTVSLTAKGLPEDTVRLAEQSIRAIDADATIPPGEK